MKRRRTTAASIAGLVVGALAWPVAIATPADALPAPICSRPSDQLGNHRADIDGDLISDPVVGLPGAEFGGGILEYGSRDGARGLHWLPGGEVRGVHASSAFGTAVARMDVDANGCDDLILTDPDHEGGAAVDVVWGSVRGPRSVGATQLLEHGPGGDGFGAAVALSRYQIRVDGEYGAPLIDLWVGAPGRTVDGQPNAGAIEHFRLNRDGTSSYLDTITQDDFPALTHASAGNRFGAVLTAETEDDPTNSDSLVSLLLVGVPNEPVGGKPGAGAVLQYPVTQGYYVRQRITQNTPGVSGGAEAGDHFGASLSVNQDRASRTERGTAHRARCRSSGRRPRHGQGRGHGVAVRSRRVQTCNQLPRRRDAVAELTGCARRRRSR